MFRTSQGRAAPKIMTVAGGAFALALMLAFAPAADAAINKCLAGKIKCVAKKAACVLKIHEKAEKKGLPLDDAKLQKCIDKFDGGTKPEKGCFEKLEAKNDGPCLSLDDTAAFEAKVDAFVDDVVTELDPTPPPAVGPANKCTAGKKKCVNKKAKCILLVYSKAAKKDFLDEAKLQKCFDKYDGGTVPEKGCFAKLEAKQKPEKPETICPTTGDSATLEAKVDAFVDDVLTELCYLPCCPNRFTFSPTVAAPGPLDPGWSGQGHDAAIVSGGLVTVAVSGCAGTPGACGVCNYSGPIDNTTNVGDLRSRRCTGNTNTICSGNADCAEPGGTCQYYFGTFLPLAAGGVSTCVSNRFTGPVSGTANVDTGDAAGVAAVTSRVYLGPSLAKPCPVCVGDALENDGIRAGTCDGGKNANQSCDANGSSPGFISGPTSLDCPPLDAGQIALLPIDLTHTTGTLSRTLTADSPNCRDEGWLSEKCFCDTCDNAAATPCTSNADCVAVGATVCGGLRCQGGANNGAPCPTSGFSSVCPSAACGIPGQATAPNTCNGPTFCVPDGGNEGVCGDGPFDLVCTPAEIWRDCLVAGDCPVSGDVCGKFRDCFTDNGVVGAVVSATGLADPPVNHESDPILANLFCIGPTTAPAVNTAAGLPGLGRLELPGHATDNGIDP